MVIFAQHPILAIHTVATDKFGPLSICEIGICILVTCHVAQLYPNHILIGFDTISTTVTKTMTDALLCARLQDNQKTILDVALNSAVTTIAETRAAVTKAIQVSDSRMLHNLTCQACLV